MKQRTWCALVIVGSLMAAAAIAFVPRRDIAVSEVQQCGMNAAPVETPTGHIACALKNGKVIHLRSTKQ